MSIKTFEDLKLQATVCHFIGTAEVIATLSQGYVLRCVLKPSADFTGSFIVEVWGTDPATHQQESQGILATFPDTASGELDVLRGETLDALKSALSLALTSTIYQELIVEEMPDAAPATWRTDTRVILDLAGESGLAH